MNDDIASYERRYRRRNDTAPQRSKKTLVLRCHIVNVVPLPTTVDDMAWSGGMTAARLVRSYKHCSKHGVVAALSTPSQSSLPRRQFSTTSSRRSQDSYKLLVLGGGTAGSAVAHKFAAKLGRGCVAVVGPSKLRRYSSLRGYLFPTSVGELSAGVD